MSAHERVGTVEILRLRVYPLDPNTADHTLSSSIVVEPGAFPLYRTADAYYWLMTGRANTRSEKIGDGLFVMGGGDQGDGPEITFPSPRFGPEQFADLLTEPAFTEGHPEQRVRVTLVVAS